MNDKVKKILGLKEGHFLAALFIVALILRVAYTLFLRRYIGREILHDEIKYLELAKDLLESGNYGDSYLSDQAHYTPGYPIFLYAIYNTYGVSILLAGFLNSLFSALIPPLIYLMASRFADYKAAALASAIAVFDPYFLYYSPLLLTETLLAFLPLLSLLLLFISLEKDSYIYLALSALVMGISTMVNPVTLPFPLIFMLYLLLQRGLVFKKFIKQSIVYLVFFSAVMTPWAVRNYFVFGTPVLTTSNTGKTFYGSNHFSSRRTNANMGTYLFGWNDFAKYFKCGDPFDELSMDRKMFKAGLTELKDNYTKIPYLELRKFINFWGVRPDPTKEKWTLNDSLSLCTYGIILIFFVIGFFKTFKPRDKIFIFHLMILLYTALALVFWGTPRFRFPVSPYIIILSSMVIVALYDSYMSKLRTTNQNV